MQKQILLIAYLITLSHGALKHHYPLCTNTLDTVTGVTAQNGAHGVAGVTFSSANACGEDNCAATFDDSVIELPYTNIDGYMDYSIQFSIYSIDYGQWLQTFYNFDIAGMSGGDDYVFLADLFLIDKDAVLYINGPKWPYDEWVMVTVVRDTTAGQIHVYFNDYLRISKNQQFNTPVAVEQGTGFLGQDTDGSDVNNPRFDPNNAMRGALHDFKIYDHAKNLAEIQSDYDEYLLCGLPIDFDGDLWDMADGSGDWQMPDDTPGVSQSESNGLCYDADGNVLEGYVEINGTYMYNGQNISSVHCYSQDEAQECFDVMGNLDVEGYSKDNAGNRIYGDLVNSCRNREVDGKYVYDFLISYMDDETPYNHDDDCFEQELNFITVNGNSDYNPQQDPIDDDDRIRIMVAPATLDWVSNGNHEVDMWWWNPVTLQIFFSVDHEDLISGWGCDYTEHEEYYQWVCDLELVILFAGEPQFVYEFQMVSTLDRLLTATLDVAVNRNVVYGDCCVNELQVTSSLHFCMDYICSDGAGNDKLETAADWTNGIKEVERRQIFYVAHRIDTSEFQTYFLQPISLHLGPFVPKIHRWAQRSSTMTYSGSGTTNLLIYELESYVALDNLTITSVALLDDRNFQGLAEPEWDADGVFVQPGGFGGSDFNERRILEGLGEDYKIKGENSMSVGESQQESKQKTKQQKNNSSVVTFAILNILGLALLII